MSVAVTEGAGKTVAADVYGGAHNPSSGEQVQFVALAGGTLGALALATPANPVFVAASQITNPSANFTRPADTTAYASGDLVANSVTAGSVVPLSWTVPRLAAGSARIRRARLKKSGTTTTNATFRLHLYSTNPASGTITNGDNGAWNTSTSGYLGSFDLDISSATLGRVFTDSSHIIAGPSVGSEINLALASGQTIYGLLEARAAYTPGNAEVFTVELEAEQL